MFKPGEIVVCVDDKFPEGILDIYNALPCKGSTYTVRDVVPGINWDLSNEMDPEPDFAPHRFRRSDELEDEVSDAAEEPVEHREYAPLKPAWKNGS